MMCNERVCTGTYHRILFPLWPLHVHVYIYIYKHVHGLVTVDIKSCGTCIHRHDRGTIKWCILYCLKGARGWFKYGSLKVKSAWAEFDRFPQVCHIFDLHLGWAASVTHWSRQSDLTTTPSIANVVSRIPNNSFMSTLFHFVWISVHILHTVCKKIMIKQFTFLALCCFHSLDFLLSCFYVHSLCLMCTLYPSCCVSEWFYGYEIVIDG